MATLVRAMVTPPENASVAVTTARDAMGSPLARLEKITKTFGGVAALRGVSLTFDVGEVHAVLGGNGAGKTTLMKIMAGLVHPDSGNLWFGSRRVTLRSAKDALRFGVGMVHQDFRLVPQLSVAENIHLGWSSTPKVRSSQTIERRTRALLERYGADLTPSARVSELAVGQQQQVAILRTLSRDPSLVILDEPTAVLTPQESASLFEMMRAAADDGRVVLFITHKIAEALAVASRVSVLRNGELAGSWPRAECESNRLAQAMVGRAIAAIRGRERTRGAAVLLAQCIAALGDRGEPAVRGVDLEVRSGEILGVAGISGNGQLELAETLCGLRPFESGRLTVGGKPVRSGRPRDFIAAGGAFIPEDRIGVGMAADASVEANAILRTYESRQLRRGPWQVGREVSAFARRLVADTEAVVPSLTAPVHQLSGGNAQRLLVGREIRFARTLIVAMYPTQGLDIAASARVREELLVAACRGLGVLLISEDLDEIYTVADVIVVMYHGSIVARIMPSESRPDEIGLLMSGVVGAVEPREGGAL